MNANGSRCASPGGITGPLRGRAGPTEKGTTKPPRGGRGVRQRRAGAAKGGHARHRGGHVGSTNGSKWPPPSGARECRRGWRLPNGEVHTVKRGRGVRQGWAGGMSAECGRWGRTRTGRWWPMKVRACGQGRRRRVPSEVRITWQWRRARLTQRCRKGSTNGRSYGNRYAVLARSPWGPELRWPMPTRPPMDWTRAFQSLCFFSSRGNTVRLVLENQDVQASRQPAYKILLIAVDDPEFSRKSGGSGLSARGPGQTEPGCPASPREKTWMSRLETWMSRNYSGSVPLGPPAPVKHPNHFHLLPATPAPSLCPPQHLDRLAA